MKDTFGWVTWIQKVTIAILPKKKAQANANTTTKLHWLDSRREKITYLFAQGFGNCVAEAYRVELQHGSRVTPSEFVLEQTLEAIRLLENNYGS